MSRLEPSLSRSPLQLPCTKELFSHTKFSAGFPGVSGESVIDTMNPDRDPRNGCGEVGYGCSRGSPAYTVSGQSGLTTPGRGWDHPAEEPLSARGRQQRSWARRLRSDRPSHDTRRT